MIPDLQTKSKTMKNADQAQVTVYHIAISHHEEIWGNSYLRYRAVLARGGAIFLDFTIVMENGERERIENYFNELVGNWMRLRRKSDKRVHKV